MQTTSRAPYLLITALLTIAACGSPTQPVDPTIATGVPGAIIRVTNEYAGGQRRFDSLRVDSATGIWRRTRCGPVSASVTNCGTSAVQRDSGEIIGIYRTSLFARARRAEFVALQAEYRRTGVTPPDGSTDLLEVIQNGRRKRVRWESGVDLPNPIGGFLCNLDAARGALILCAD